MAETTLPLGFCADCLEHLDKRTFEGLRVPLAGGRLVVGGYCRHNQVAAVRCERGDLVGPWRLVTPVGAEDLVEIMARAAAQFMHRQLSAEPLDEPPAHLH